MPGGRSSGDEREPAGTEPAPLSAPAGAEGPGRGGFVAELRRRQIPRAATAYVVASVGIMQASEAVTRILGLPHWIPRAVLVPVALGFFANLWVAWHFVIGLGGASAPPASGPAGPGSGWAPRRRLVLKKPTWAVIAAMAVAAAGLATWRYVVVRTIPVRTQTILIADIDNRTGESVFDGTLEPALGLAMEGASFITSYSRSGALRSADRMKLEGSGLSEKRARLVAQREGIGVVTSGSVEKSEDGYRVSIRAVDAFTGKTIVKRAEEVPGKDEVLGAVTKLAARVRSALGDETPAGVQIREGETFSASSLEAAHEYALGAQRSAEGKYDEAAQHYLAAIRLDPGLGRAHSGLAVIEGNRGHHPEAERHFREAMAHLDRMTEREKYRTRGAYYLTVNRDPDKAVEAFSALVRQFPADNAGLANLALAWLFKGDPARALEEGRRAVAIYPGNVPQRNNVGMYAMYMGDFEAAIREQERVLELNPGFANGYFGLAQAQLAAGRRDAAVATWNRLAGLGPGAASLAAEGLADLAVYEGRLAEARALLEAAIEADQARGAGDGAARKQAVLAAVQLARGEAGRAVAAAERAARAAQDDYTLLGAAVVLAQAGESRKALKLANDLDRRLAPEPRMYAEVVRGAEALARRDYPGAVERFRAAVKRVDSWLAHYALGRAYLEAGAFAEAQDELEGCKRRRGEAADVFYDFIPTYRLYPPVEYYLGRAKEGLQNPAAADSYAAYLAIRPGTEDALGADARRRLAKR